MYRISKDDYYMEIAKSVSLRSTCLRAKTGAVIVKNDSIISTGYSGAPRGDDNCCDLGTCERDILGIKPGMNYEICRSVHAEMNAIINASRSNGNIFGSKIYIYLKRLDGQKIKHGSPCLMCMRVIKNAGINDYALFEDV